MSVSSCADNCDHFSFFDANACCISPAWFHICCASTTGSASDSHFATGGAPANFESMMPWHSAQCRVENTCLPRPASPGFSKYRADMK